MNARRLALSTLNVAALLALGACGGGGGGGGPGPDSGPTIDIGLANYMAVGQATATGVYGMNPMGMAVPLSVSSPGSQRLISLGAHQLSKHIASASAQRQYPQAVGEYTYPCNISGTFTERDDDNDNDLIPGVGDSITLTFNNCQDVAGETINGTIAMSLTQISTTPVSSISAKVTYTQLSYVTAKHSMTYDGSLWQDYTNPSPSVETMRATAAGSVTIVVSTHTGLTDTVALLDGFVEDASYDSSLGRTVSTANGLLHSVAAGGVVQISPVPGAPITQYDADAYPNSGAVQVKGMNSTLQVTAVSATNVRLDLDANGDGTFESRSTMLWDDLL